MQLTDQDIHFLREVFSKNPVKKAFIFGSWSRNEADKDSDLDVLVELDYSKHIGLGFVKMKHEIEDILQRKVDLVSERSVSRHILPFIEKDKQLIYER